MNRNFEIPYKNIEWYSVFIAGFQPAGLRRDFFTWGASAPSFVISGLRPACDNLFLGPNCLAPSPCPFLIPTKTESGQLSIFLFPIFRGDGGRFVVFLNTDTKKYGKESHS